MNNNKNSLLTNKLEDDNWEELAEQFDIESEEVNRINSLSGSNRAKISAVIESKCKNADGFADMVSVLKQHPKWDDIMAIYIESCEYNAEDYKSLFCPSSKFITESRKTQEKQTVWESLLIVPIIIVCVSITCIIVYAVMKNEPTFTPHHNFVEPEEFNLRLNNMTQKFKKQDEMFWQQINKSGFNHLKRVFDENKETLNPFTIFIAGYNGTKSTINCFLKDLGYTFTNKPYATLNSEGVSKESLDEQTIQSLKNSQKYVVVKDIHKMSYDAASLFMAYADEHMDNAVISFPQSIIVLTAEMPFFVDHSYDRKADELRVRNHFVFNLWGEDENKNAALWSRIGNLLVLLKPESWTDPDRCD